MRGRVVELGITPGEGGIAGVILGLGVAVDIADGARTAICSSSKKPRGI